jgi:site-specific DNA recombinase
MRLSIKITVEDGQPGMEQKTTGREAALQSLASNPPTPRKADEFKAVAELITPNPPDWLTEHLSRWASTILMSQAVELRQPTRAWPQAPCRHRRRQRLRLEWLGLSEPQQDRESHHRRELERTPLLRAAGGDQAMKHTTKKVLRCAIYTRVSTDAGLEQDFNSLDAQREASEAYIKSQAHEGWRLVRAAYDDGGFSGGSLERPALQKLLGDVRAGHVDVIVVYKVDRLTRSLADFAKLFELFDAHGVSFVSVAQSFNTTSSMGRLTLNVLLSFAQFEREVTGERIRDKIAASKKKGIWVGGNVPLGYRAEDRKLVIDRDEAKTVRMIFERYLALGSMLQLLEELNRNGIKTKARQKVSGEKVGGIPFTGGPLACLLKNRTYLGEIKHHDTSYPGEHESIIDRKLFDAVQAKLRERANRIDSRGESRALLQGKLFDDADNLMTPTHAKKGELRYRYYISRALVEGRKSEAGSINRVPADDIEAKIVEAVRGLPHVGVSSESSSEEFRSTIRAAIDRVTVRDDRLVIELAATAEEGTKPPRIEVKWERGPKRARREVLLPEGRIADSRPIRSENRSTLLRSIALGRSWLNEIASGKVKDIDALAAREKRSVRSIRMTVSLAFLAPGIVEAAVAGKLPRGIGATRLADLPASWREQWADLGFNSRL